MTRPLNTVSTEDKSPMRFHEISSGIRLPVSNEEQEMMDFIASKERVGKAELDERQQEVTRLMVSRGLLIREKDGEEIFLRPNDLSDIWRN